MPHDSRPDSRSSRRRFLAAAAGVVGSAAAARAIGDRTGGLLGGGRLDAAELRALTEPAAAESPAERLAIRPPELRRPPEGMIAFPIDPAAESYVLDNYGDCRSSYYGVHIGVDIISERGAEVYAVVDGELVDVYEDTGTAGWGWEIRSDDGERFRYFHLDALAEGLAVGDRVRFGDVIGGVGSSGNFKWVDGERVEDRDNIHLHFEYWPDEDTHVDPLPLLDVPEDVAVSAPIRRGNCGGGS